MTPLEAAPALSATAGGLLLVLALMVPVAAVLAILATPARAAPWIALLALAFGTAVALGVVVDLGRSGAAIVHIVGGWMPPLGLALRADGLSGAMIVMTAVVMTCVGVSAYAQTSDCDGRANTTFWILLLTIWAGLSAVFVGNDLFNLYVALELLTFAAVPLVCLDGRAETTAAALQYLVFAMVGSLFYLLGAALIYGEFGTLDLSILSQSRSDNASISIALSLMIVGLLAKTALFPLHIWLPPAHAGARAPASAILSALVVKAPVFLIVRLVSDVAPATTAATIGQVLGVLGAVSIVFCSILAVSQTRLKLMIAYSTIAQLGYLFIAFPLATPGDGTHAWSPIAWTGGTLQLMSHAFAKSAMFLAAGVVADEYGHDRVADLGGFGRQLPLTAATFVIAGLSLVGIPPTGGFSAKYMLLSAAFAANHVWLMGAMIVGGLLAAGYIFRLLDRAFAEPVACPSTAGRSRRGVELGALCLAFCALLLGFVPLQPSEFLQIGHALATPGAGR